MTSSVEHSAVLAYCDYLEKVHGVEVTRLPVDSKGGLDPDKLRSAIRDDTALVSLMWANNETGVIWPITELAGICNEMGVPLHTDAVQAVGKIPVSFSEAGVGYLSLSGHKFGATKGIGALVVREPNTYCSFIHGGKQEYGHRGGTENVASIVAIGRAADLAMEGGFEVWNRTSIHRSHFESALVERFDGAQVNGEGSNRLPTTSNIHVPGIDGDALVTLLDQHGICISSGSACLESAITPSHVILAMSGSHDRAAESVRVSFALASTQDELSELLSVIDTYAGQLLQS